MGAKEWKWYGNAGHLIVGNDCRFHLCTEVGKYLVSTVGEYYPRYEPNRKKPETIGCDRTYETMVFRLNGGRCECGCGLPKPDDWTELDFNGYNDPQAATAGHYELCHKWSRRRAQ